MGAGRVGVEGVVGIGELGVEVGRADEVGAIVIAGICDVVFGGTVVPSPWAVGAGIVCAAGAGVSLIGCADNGVGNCV